MPGRVVIERARVQDLRLGEAGGRRLREPRAQQFGGDPLFAPRAIRGGHFRDERQLLSEGGSGGFSADLVPFRFIAEHTGSIGFHPRK